MTDPIRPDARPRDTKDIGKYYDWFSLEVGFQDWLIPNGRHEQLKLLVGQILDGRRGLQLLDVGCGGGVMSASLANYGDVSGIDISDPAIRLARDLVPKGHFVSGQLGPGVLEEQFDVITLFDVLEHVPVPELGELLDELDRRLAPNGMVIASTPHPAFIRWLRDSRPELLQVIDEPVELRTMLEYAIELDWELCEYRTYDIDRGPRQYQLMAFGRIVPRGDHPHRPPTVLRRERLRTNRIARVVRRLPVALRLARARGLTWALWVVGFKRRPTERTPQRKDPS